MFRAADVPHTNRVGSGGTHSLVVEVGAERLEALRRHTRVLDGVTHRRDPVLAALGRQMARELACRDAAAPLALEGLALELLARASRGSGDRAPRTDDARDAAWLGRVRDLLHARLGDRTLRVSDLAAAAGVHPVYLARVFRARYGTTPGAYLRGAGVDWAAGELAATARPLVEVALAAGFADQSHFTRAFRARIGVSPGQWRARRRPGGR